MGQWGRDQDGPKTGSQGFQALLGRQGSRGYWRPLGEGRDPGLVLGPLAGEGWVHALEQSGPLLGAKLVCTVC